MKIHKSSICWSENNAGKNKALVNGRGSDNDNDDDDDSDKNNTYQKTKVNSEGV